MVEVLLNLLVLVSKGKLMGKVNADTKTVGALTDRFQGSFIFGAH